MKKTLELLPTTNIGGKMSVSSGKENLFLLRVWPTRNEWKASLKNVDTKEIKYFSDLNALRLFMDGLE